MITAVALIVFAVCILVEIVRRNTIGHMESVISSMIESITKNRDCL